MDDTKSRKISINFTNEYIEVYTFLKSQPNISNYICKLVKAQMIQENDDYIDKKVRKIVAEVLKTAPLYSNNINLPTQDVSINSIASKEDIVYANLKLGQPLIEN